MKLLHGGETARREDGGGLERGGCNQACGEGVIVNAVYRMLRAVRSSSHAFMSHGLMPDGFCTSFETL